MTLRLLTMFIVIALSIDVIAEDHQLKVVKTAPKGLSKAIAANLNPNGYRITAGNGPVCDFWMLKSVALKPGFKETFSIKYPFTPGQLIGALQVSKGIEFTDFRGQVVDPGVYTLRYGHQPEDGNHIGTADIVDFLMAVPAKLDTDPKTIKDLEKLMKTSGKSVGATHPAIFSLQTIDEKIEKTELSHDEDHDFWILNFNANGKAKDKKVKVSMRLVAIGQSSE